MTRQFSITFALYYFTLHNISQRTVNYDAIENFIVLNIIKLYR